MYPNAYGSNCDSGSSQPYSLPDLGSLKEDPLLPQRCQDPTVMQVSSLPRMVSSSESAQGCPFLHSTAALKHQTFTGCCKAWVTNA